MSVRIIVGDCRDTLRTLPDASVHCCVTSPPYFGLRDYGNADQIGLERTPDAFVAELVAVFREVRRVLRDDGTVWLNLGDSYAANGVRTDTRGGFNDRYFGTDNGGGKQAETIGHVPPAVVPSGLKPKDLIGIPWRVAFALQADGWWLRQDIIWHKPNPMPESVTDRCTKAHEYIFLLSKSARYYYDAAAIAEEAEHPDMKHKSTSKTPQQSAAFMGHAPTNLGRCGTSDNGTRNRRSVWTVATQPFSEAHFATFPPDLIEPCVKAGTSEHGCCPGCGAPWERDVKVVAPDGRVAATTKGGKSYDADGRPLMGDNMIDHGVRGSFNAQGGRTLTHTTIGWVPSCECPAHDPVPCTVLDPFGGAGTTGLVADRLGRNAILCELNPEYAEMAQRRIAGDAPLFAAVTVASADATP
jgi:DNA modification methylase